MLYLIGGLAILGGLLLLLYLFITTDPAKLAKGAKWLLVALAIAVALFLLLSDRFSMAVAADRDLACRHGAAIARCSAGSAGLADRRPGAAPMRRRRICA